MTTLEAHSETTREEAYNVILGELLRERGVRARAERRGRRGSPDVRVELTRNDLILVECKYEGGRSALEGQLDKRLKSHPEALAAVGVIYPGRFRYAEDTRAELESANDLEWWLQGTRESTGESGQSLKGNGSVAELADYLRTLPLQLEGVDRVVAAASAIGAELETSAKQIGKHARTARRIADIIAKTDQEKDRAAALRIGCLVLFNALAFQDRLAAANENVQTVGEALGRGISGLQGAWRQICVEIDYVPVFELASNILNVLADGPDDVHEPVIKPLVRAMTDTRQLEGHDLSGRLFHTLLTDAKFSGAYYTSVPAATLLSRLVFHNWPPGVDWADHELPASLNIADLACGTGTLLMAVASEAERRHADAGGKDAAELHKAMVEQALHGYDVQLSAVHFAATSLAMLNPHIQFDHMNLYVMPLGAEGSNVALGSLDFMGEGQAAVQFAISAKDMGVETQDAGRVSGTGAKGVEQGVVATLPELNLAIMNPPFTRSVGGNLLFGSLPAPERQKLQKELSKRLKQRQASATAGLGSAFVATVVPRLRPGEGRLALVLPATVATGPSWQQTRTLIEQNFTLDMVIASHDPRKWNFSDSTDLSETLLIATRRPDERDDNERRTTFVNLWQNPDGVLEAHRLAQAITTTSPAKFEGTGTALLEIDGRHIGEALSIPESTLLRKKWSGMQFARTDLIRGAVRLLDDSEVWVPSEEAPAGIPLCPVGELGAVGPDVRDVRDGFEPTDAVTAYPMVENHDTERRRRLLTIPNKYLAPLARPRAGRHLKPIAQLWQKAGRLLVAERLRLNTARIVAMSTETPVLSNVWWPIKTDNHMLDKAIAVWLNGSVGLLTLLAIRNTTEGSWVKLKKADLEKLPVLDVRELASEQVQALSDLYDDVADMEFERLPAMAHDPARKALDDGLSRILGLPDLAPLRELLATEPVVSGKRL